MLHGRGLFIQIKMSFFVMRLQLARGTSPEMKTVGKQCITFNIHSLLKEKTKQESSFRGESGCTAS